MVLMARTTRTLPNSPLRLRPRRKKAGPKAEEVLYTASSLDDSQQFRGKGRHLGICASDVSAPATVRGAINRKGSAMTGTAQGEEMGETLQATGTEGPVNLRETVTERLAAHRSRRAQMSAQVRAEEAELEASQRRRREHLYVEQRRGISAVRDVVRARYETSQSYREFLAAEAERALAQAQAEADIAARTARAVADAQLQLLEEMEQWTETQSSPREQAFEQAQTEARGDLAHALADIALGARELMAEPSRLSVTESPSTASQLLSRHGSGAAARTEVSAGGLTVKLYEDLGPAKLPHATSAHQRKNISHPLSEGSEELATTGSGDRVPSLAGVSRSRHRDHTHPRQPDRVSA